MKKVFLGFFVFCIVLNAGASDAADCGDWNWGCDDDWGISFSVPAIKLKQGEKAKLFEGIAAGIQLNNLFGKTPGSLASGLILTPALMLSTSNTIDATGDTESDYVFSFAMLFGFKKDSASFQIGYGYDLLSSQTSAIFDKTEKGSILFSVGTSF